MHVPLEHLVVLSHHFSLEGFCELLVHILLLLPRDSDVEVDVVLVAHCKVLLEYFVGGDFEGVFEQDHSRHQQLFGLRDAYSAHVVLE